MHGEIITAGYGSIDNPRKLVDRLDHRARIHHVPELVIGKFLQSSEIARLQQPTSEILKTLGHPNPYRKDDENRIAGFGYYFDRGDASRTFYSTNDESAILVNDSIGEECVTTGEVTTLLTEVTSEYVQLLHETDARLQKRREV